MRGSDTQWLTTKARTSKQATGNRIAHHVESQKRLRPVLTCPNKSDRVRFCPPARSWAAFFRCAGFPFLCWSRIGPRCPLACLKSPIVLPSLSSHFDLGDLEKIYGHLSDFPRTPPISGPFLLTLYTSSANFGVLSRESRWRVSIVDYLESGQF
jgi:hypothetical protein